MSCSKRLSFGGLVLDAFSEFVNFFSQTRHHLEKLLLSTEIYNSISDLNGRTATPASTLSNTHYMLRNA